MKYLKIIILVATVTLGASRTQASEASEKQGLPTFPGLTKISDDLFTHSVDDSLSLAMERIDKSNIDAWQNYAQTQAFNIQELDNKNFETWKKHAETTTETLKHAPPKKSDGAAMFLDTLSKYQKNQIKKSCNELWIAYASHKPITQKAQFNSPEKNEPSSLEMFMCVITSPQALITTHMGISRTFEALQELPKKNQLRTNHPPLSMHLHSVAAQVMKLKNPRRKYMLTAPMQIMRKILLYNLPQNSVFIGDDLYQKKLEDIKENQNQLKAAYDMFKDDIRLLETNPPRIICDDFLWLFKRFTVKNTDGTPLVSFHSITSAYQWMFAGLDAFRGSLTFPYVLVNLDALAAVTNLKHSN